MTFPARTIVITVDRRQNAATAAAAIAKEQTMNKTSAKLSNHHVACVKNAPKYSVQTRSDTSP